MSDGDSGIPIFGPTGESNDCTSTDVSVEDQQGLGVRGCTIGNGGMSVLEPGAPLRGRVSELEPPGVEVCELLPGISITGRGGMEKSSSSKYSRYSATGQENKLHSCQLSRNWRDSPKNIRHGSCPEFTPC